MSSFGIPVRNGLGVGLLASTSLSTRNSSAFSPASLFAAGESGYWLDPSDFSTMWQDSQGVTPVTATGQTCGLILDKRIGTRTQVFDDANVTFPGSGSYAGRISPGVYEYARDVSTSGTVQFNGLTAGSTYLISVQISAYAGAIPGITGISANWVNTAFGTFRPVATSAGTYTAFYVSAGTFFRIASNAFNGGGTISNVSILEVPGNHFLQATAASRPLVQTDGTNNYLAFDGTDDRLLSAANINPGAVDKAQVFMGLRSLRTTAGTETIADAGSVVFGSNGWWRLTRGNGGLTTANFESRGTTTVTTGNPAIATPPWTAVLTGLGDIGAPSVILRSNGAQIGSSTATQGTGDYTTLPHAVGASTNGAGPYNGRVYQMVMRFGPNLTADQITQTETFVNSKTGAY